MLNRRHLIQAAALSGIPMGIALAQPAFPSKPLRIVVPFGAGGVADLTARAVAQQLSVNLGQPVVIDNRPGAGGIVAAELVAKAEPDGHTLLLMSNGTAVSAGLFKSLPFNPRTDFAPVSLLGLFDIAIVVPESSPHKTLAELIGFGRANPGQLNIGTINIGSTQHLAAELLRTQANLIANHSLQRHTSRHQRIARRSSRCGGGDSGTGQTPNQRQGRATVGRDGCQPPQRPAPSACGARVAGPEQLQCLVMERPCSPRQNAPSCGGSPERRSGQSAGRSRHGAAPGRLQCASAVQYILAAGAIARRGHQALDRSDTKSGHSAAVRRWVQTLNLDKRLKVWTG